MKRFLGLALVLGWWAALAVHSAAQPPITEVPGPQRPFTDTMADMARRDLRWLWEIEQGLRPPRPRLLVIGEHEAEEVREGPVEETSTFFLPAVFLPPEEGTPNALYRHILAPQTKGANFTGITLQNQYNQFGRGVIPPDTCGAIGPHHFLQVINGSVAVYTRSGTRLSHVTLESFFTVNVGGTTYPRDYAFDPRVVYDRRSGRFFATALENNYNSNNHVVLAISRTSDPTGTWDKYIIPIGQSGKFTDYDTLGVDDNGVYVAATLFGSSATIRIAATRKASLLSSPPYLDTVYFVENPSGFYATPQPALNLDAVASTGRAWIVGSSSTSYSNMRAAYFTWPSSGAPTFSSVMTVSLPAYAFPPDAPAKGSTLNIDVGDMRMHPAMIRNNRLYTCRHIGVNSVGGSSGADRTGIEWIELDVSTSTPSVVQSGRLYDGAASDPVFFYYPSVAVNGLGQMAVSFSDSNGNRWVAAETCGRLSTDPSGTLQAIMEIVPGQNKYTLTFGGSDNRWGDYSYSSVDPNDDLSIWTIQEFATSTQNIWGTWITQLLAPAPTLNNPNGSGQAGATGVILDLTGRNLFDPGPGFPNRLNVQLTGGTINGISNYVITYNSPTSVRVQFDIASNASPGARNIVLTNPDGQQVTVANGFTVQASNGTTLTVANVSGSIRETVNLQATLTRTSDGTPVAGKTIAFTVNGAAAGTGVTNGSGVASVAYTIPESLGTGSATIGASFAGDPPYEPSSGTGTLTVNKAATTTAVANASGRIGETVSLQATLTRNTDGAALASRTIAFQVAGSGAGSASTNASGVATHAYTIPESLGVGNATIRADFAGDSLHLASFGTGTLAISKGQTALAVANRTGQIGATINLSAALTCVGNGAPVVGRTVAFDVDGTGAGSGITNASGVAEISYAIPPGSVLGDHTIGGSFAGDTAYEPSSGTGTLTVQKAACTVTASDAAGAFNATVTLGATLVRATDNAPLGGRLLSFSVEGTSVGDGTTDGAGYASVLFTIPEALGRGAKTILAAFAGDSAHNSASDTATLSVTGWPTALAVTDTAGMVSQSVNLVAVLTRSDTSTALSGRTVSFTVAGTGAGSGITDSLGVVTVPYVIPDTVGSGPKVLQASFAGDTLHEPSTGLGTLTITKAPTSLFVPDRTGTITEVVTLRGYLRRTTDNAWVVGRSVAFQVDGTAVGSGTTNSNGRADCNWTITAGGASRAITGAFAGDAAYTGSSGNGTLTCQSWATKMATFGRTQRISGRTELKCRLLRSDNVPLYNKTINFYVDGTFVIARPTNTQGYASYPYYDVPDGAGAGTRTILSEWPGSAGYAAISKTATLTVLKALPYIWVMPRSVPRGGIAKFYAYFRRLYDYKKQEGKLVTFRLDGTWIADVTTGSGAVDPGVARYNFNTSGLSVGTHTIRCEFAGDPWVDAGYGEGTLTIY